MGKVFEIVINIQLNNFVEEEGILPDCQFGFWYKHSTIPAFYQSPISTVRCSTENLWDQYAETHRNLGKAIKNSKLQSVTSLQREVGQDPWGKPYKVVLAKLRR